MKGFRRSLIYYGILNTEHPDVFLTFCLNKKQIHEFVVRYIVLQNFSHFEAWCRLHELNKDAQNVQDRYVQTCISDEEKQKYVVKKLGYTREGIAALLRMFSHVPPIGCSFDQEIEYSYFMQDVKNIQSNPELSEEAKKELENNIAELEEALSKIEEKGESTDAN